MKNFILAIIIIVLAILSHNLEARTVIQLHTISYHVNRAANFNEENYGIAVKYYTAVKKRYYFDYVQAGTYKNSENNQSNYAGVGFEWPVGIFTIGVKAGLITGYSLGSVLPYFVPVIKYKNIGLVFAPYPEAVTHLTFDVIEF